MSVAALVADLQAVLSPGALVTMADELPAYGRDFWAQRGVPGLRVRPAGQQRAHIAGKRLSGDLGLGQSDVGKALRVQAQHRQVDGLVDEIADAVVRLATDESLAGRVMVCWNGKPPRLIAAEDAGYAGLE